MAWHANKLLPMGSLVEMWPPMNCDTCWCIHSAGTAWCQTEFATLLRLRPRARRKTRPGWLTSCDTLRVQPAKNQSAINGLAGLHVAMAAVSIGNNSHPIRVSPSCAPLWPRGSRSGPAGLIYWAGHACLSLSTSPGLSVLSTPCTPRNAPQAQVRLS